MIFASESRPARLAIAVFTFALASGVASAQERSNPNCPTESVFFDPGHGQDIAVPNNFKVSVFAKDLNFPTGIAFRGDSKNFQVFVVESGKGLPSGSDESTDCNSNNKATVGGPTSPTNPFTPDLLVFDEKGNKVAGPLGKFSGPTSASLPSRMDSAAAPCSAPIRIKGCAARRAAGATTPRASSRSIWLATCRPPR